MARIKAKDLPAQVTKTILPAPAKRSKFRNKRVKYQGWAFDSQLEADFYKNLQLCANIELLLRQVPLHLAPGSKYVVDFLIKYKDDPVIHFVDTKGVMTDHSRTKIKIAEHLYGIKIEIVKRGDF